MTRKLMKLSILTGVLLIVALLVGCGEEKKEEAASEVPDIPMPQESTGDDSLNKRIEELQTMEMTVEVVKDGESLVTWSQKDGNWRWQDPDNEDFYVIYNASQSKTWMVDNDMATEMSGGYQQYMGMNPASYLEIYAAMPGARRGDSWEYNMPGGGKLSMEFKGPEGMITKVATTDADNKETEVIEFKYSDVGSVSDSLFELPAGVTVQQMPSGMGISVPEA